MSCAGAAGAKGEMGTKDGPKEEEIDPNAPWHTKMLGTCKKHWSTHKTAIMKFANTRKKTANKDAKKLQGFLGKCGGGGKDSVCCMRKRTFLFPRCQRLCPNSQLIGKSSHMIVSMLYISMLFLDALDQERS